MKTSKLLLILGCCIPIASFAPSARAQANLKFLVDRGDATVDYEKFGHFENPGTFDYRYLITLPDGLARASGEGVFPNRNAEKNPNLERVRKSGKLMGTLNDQSGIRLQIPGRDL